MAPSTSAQERIHQAALRLFAERGVTQVNVKELALAAGVARGTIYAHVSEPERLFEDVAGQLAAEMNERVALSFQGVVDPAHRLANGIRFYVRRAHEEPDWGRFINRFAFANPSMQQMWNGQPVQDLMNGVLEGRYRFQTAQLPSVVGLVAGGVLACMGCVLIWGKALLLGEPPLARANPTGRSSCLCSPAVRAVLRAGCARRRWCSILVLGFAVRSRSAAGCGCGGRWDLEAARAGKGGLFRCSRRVGRGRCGCRLRCRRRLRC